MTSQGSTKQRQDKVDLFEGEKTSKKFFSLENVNPEKVILPAIIGLSLGALFGIGKQISNIEYDKKIELDPEAPYIITYDRDLAKVLETLIRDFYNSCLNEYKKDYKQLVREAIDYIDCMLAIFDGCVHGLIKRNYRTGGKATAYAELAMVKLRKILPMLQESVVENFHKIVEVISNKLKDHLINIRQLIITS